MKEPDPALVRSFSLAATEIAVFEAAAARLFSDPELPSFHLRDLRDRIDALAERSRRHEAALRETATSEGGANEANIERIDRLFLAELEGGLEEGLRFMERRLGLMKDPGATAPRPEEADRALRVLDCENAPSPASIDALGLVAVRAALLEERSRTAKNEEANNLERELIEVKRKTFLEFAELAKAENPELLFKCRLALEKKLAADSPALVAPEARTEGVVALFSGPGSSLQAELFEHGLRLRIEFRPSSGPTLPAGSVEGWVEAGGERAAFRLVDPRRPIGTQPTPSSPGGGLPASSFLDFLATHELKPLYKALEAKYARLSSGESDMERASSAATRLSEALNNLL